jgi:hypothetical protein
MEGAVIVLSSAGASLHDKRQRLAIRVKMDKDIFIRR